MKGLIVAGGNVDPGQLKDIWISLDHPYVIGVDRGCVYLLQNNIAIDKAVGDFDSVSEAERTVIENFFDTELLNPEKDDTDTEHALLMMLEKEVSEIVMLGCTGTRLDQTFASIRALKLAVDAGVDAYIVDLHNRIRVAKDVTIISSSNRFGKYISVMPYGDRMEGLTEHGFKYEVTDFNLEAAKSRGVSNELARDVGMITSKDYYIVMETDD